MGGQKNSQAFWSHTFHQNSFSFRPPFGIDNVPHSGGPWRTWELTGGKEGEEPPAKTQLTIGAANVAAKAAEVVAEGQREDDLVGVGVHHLHYGPA